MSGALPFAPAPGGGVRLAVRLTPRARRAGVEGVGTDADGRPLLRLRVTAPPVENAANAALIALVAEALGLRKAEVTLEAGATGRTKRLHLRGEPALLLPRLEAWVAGAR